VTEITGFGEAEFFEFEFVQFVEEQLRGA